MGEVEKDSFIALPGKGSHSGLIAFKTMCPNAGHSKGVLFQVDGGADNNQSVSRALIFSNPEIIWH